MLTIPFALYGIFRYTDQVYNNNKWCEPEMMFRDVGIMLDIVIWLIIVIIVLMKVPEYLLFILHP
jgi:hypothetical protein